MRSRYCATTTERPSPSSSSHGTRAPEIWNGYRPGVEGAVADYGADEARPVDELLEDAIPKLFEKARRIYHLLGRRGDIDARLLAALEEDATAQPARM